MPPEGLSLLGLDTGGMLSPVTGAVGACDITARMAICQGDPWSMGVEYLRRRAWVSVLPGQPIRPIPVGRVWKLPLPPATLQLTLAMGDRP